MDSSKFRASFTFLILLSPSWEKENVKFDFTVKFPDFAMLEVKVLDNGSEEILGMSYIPIKHLQVKNVYIILLSFIVRLPFHRNLWHDWPEHHELERHTSLLRNRNKQWKRALRRRHRENCFAQQWYIYFRSEGKERENFSYWFANLWAINLLVEAFKYFLTDELIYVAKFTSLIIDRVITKRIQESDLLLQKSKNDSSKRKLQKSVKCVICSDRKCIANNPIQK